MATITKRGGGQWQAKVRKKGFSTQNKTFPTKAKAEQWARMVESEMDRGIFMSTSIAENTRLSELFDRYVNEVAPSKKSEVDIKYRTKFFNSHFGHLIIAGITPLTI